MLRSGDYRYRSLSVICRSTGNWEIAEPLVVGGYVAQACGVANIHWVEELLHWQQGSSRRVREHLASYLHIHHPSIIGSLRRSGNPLSSWYQISSVYSVSIHKSIPVDLLFFVLSRKSPTKRVGLVRAIAIDQPNLLLLVAACVDLAFRFFSVLGLGFFSVTNRIIRLSLKFPSRIIRFPSVQN